MKNKFWIIALLAISFTGCYTSFVPRDYELESYENYGDENYYAENDTVVYLDENDNYDSEDNTIIINNYPDQWSWGYGQSIHLGYYVYDPFYNPYYDPYWGPYYSSYYSPFYDPYYGGNVYVYGDFYWGSNYSDYNYPSSTRYRNDRNHWTNLRNNGGRVSVSRDGNTNTNIADDRNTFDRLDKVREIDLDGGLRVTRPTTSASGVTKTADVKTSTIRKNGESKTVTRKTTDLERRRVSDKIIDKGSNRESIETQNQNKQKVTKKSDIIYKTKITILLLKAEVKEFILQVRVIEVVTLKVILSHIIDLLQAQAVLIQMLEAHNQEAIQAQEVLQ